ncbi:polyprenyl synthetase family protein [Microlunatus soli]|uniref:Geranylgeranyl diphosphate synthase, type I n=1 Tax=Microlunatus soli TaxID=630515 RepID=A0A1H1PHV4_9ACTN|nr:polyprenyl synthetase family protein [Microlunatus soli]SDS10615.1 geranylgeranyl diphosphate synthase, type I [Microlunatus soli]
MTPLVPPSLDPAPLDPTTPLNADFTDAISAAIGNFLDGQTEVLKPLGAELDPVQRIAADLTGGGKRLRPAFCYWGYVAVAGEPGRLRPALLSAAASLELLHVSALVHDDVMDSSDLRRGLPAAHRRFERLHDDLGWVGDPTTFGRAGAILLGDLLLMWSMQMLHQAGLPLEMLDRGLPIIESMRTEVTAGQFLDVVAQARDHASYLPGRTAGDDAELQKALDEAARVVEYKSARYTVRRPLQFGAALGGADDAADQQSGVHDQIRLHDQLGAFGSPIGRAFQYRDDLLGVFGDSAVTGKPSGDDLREGKRTVLVAQALAGADPAGRRLLESQLGNKDLDADGIAGLQQVITESGAREAVEKMIDHDYSEAMTVLADAPITDAGRTALTALASAAVRRSF